MNIFLIIYLSGFILSYLSCKYYEVSLYKQKWTKNLRLKVIKYSFWSWIGFIVTFWAILEEFNGEDEASW